MFAATLTLTIAGNARVLNRVNQDSYGSEYSYSDATQNISMLIRHSVDSVDKDGMTMKRHNVFVERTVYPTPTAAMQKCTATVTMRNGKFDSPVDTADLFKALAVLLAASSSAMVTDLSVGVN
nr:MAG: hypothetical protein 2 [Leviviridae sp.]